MTKQERQQKYREYVEAFKVGSSAQADFLKNWFKPQSVAGDRSINYTAIIVVLLGIGFIIYKFRSK